MFGLGKISLITRLNDVNSDQTITTKCTVDLALHVLVRQLGAYGQDAHPR